ncbi:MAG: rod shape-determining protein MreD [Sphingomonadales bacterium]
MNRIAGSNADVTLRNARRQYVPIISTIAACLLSLVPIVMSSPMVPDFGMMVLISWRLLRPEMWTATTALPLGLLNDLIAGHPLGQSMALWTILFLAYDVMDARLVWRDYWMDWFIAAMSIIFYTFGGWYIGRLMGSAIQFEVMLPQIGVSILAYPVVARIVLGLDRWRLSR